MKVTPTLIKALTRAVISAPFDSPALISEEMMVGRSIKNCLEKYIILTDSFALFKGTHPPDFSFINQRMQYLKMTKPELAIALGVSRNAVYTTLGSEAWKLTTFKKFSKALGVSIEALMLSKQDFE